MPLSFKSALKPWAKMSTAEKDAYQRSLEKKTASAFGKEPTKLYFTKALDMGPGAREVLSHEEMTFADDKLAADWLKKMRARGTVKAHGWGPSFKVVDASFQKYSRG